VPRNEPLGCVIDQQSTVALCKAIEAGKCGPARSSDFSVARPTLQGAYRRNLERGVTCVFLHDVETKLFGKPQPAWYQRRGTCFPAGTPIAMADGTEKPIEAVRVGDMVLSHTGTPRRVSETMDRSYTGRTYSIAVKGWPWRLRMTDEHPVAVFQNDEAPGGHGFVRGEMNWVPANRLAVGDFVLMTHPQTREKSVTTLDLATVVDIPTLRQPKATKCPLVTDGGIRFPGSRSVVRRHVVVNAEFGRLVGLYLAEGNCERRRVTFTFSGDELAMAEECRALILSVFGVEATILHLPNGKNVTRVRIDNLTMAQVFKSLCPGDALSKRVPVVVFRASSEVRMEVLRGWLDGDGHVKRRGNAAVTTGVTSSAMLNRDLHRLSMSCGLKPSSAFRKKSEHQRVAATTLDFATADSLSIGIPFDIEPSGRRRTYYSRQPEGIVCRIDDVVAFDVACERVFNIEVDEEHSYVANGIAVHNCVGQSLRAIQTTQFNSISQKMAIGVPKQIAYEVAYAGARYITGQRRMGGSHPWPCSCDGCNDGLIPEWIAEFVGTYGVIPRDLYGDVDLRRPREDYAVNWVNAGPPRSLLEIGKAHPVAIQNIPINGRAKESLADALASLIAVANAMPRYAGERNANGISKLTNPGSHQTHFTGYLHIGGKLYFIYQQSHGPGRPGGPNKCKHDGGVLDLADGECVVEADEVMSNLTDGGALWLFELLAGSLWRK
jgi:hypothetical protein